MHQAELAFFLMSQKKYCDFGRSTVSNRVEPYSAMNNSKLFVSAICVLGLTLAAPLSTEAGRGGGGRGGGGSYASGARGGSFARGGYAPGGYARGGYARSGYGGYAGVAMLGLEWGRLELDGTALTGAASGTVAAIGTAPTMAVIGAVEQLAWQQLARQ